MSDMLINVLGDGGTSVSKSEFVSLLLRDSRVEDATEWYEALMESTGLSKEVAEHEDSRSRDRIKSLGPLLDILHSSAHLLLIPILDEVLDTTQYRLSDYLDDEPAAMLARDLVSECRGVLHDSLLGSMISSTTLMCRMGLLSPPGDSDMELDERLVLGIEDWLGE